LCYAAVCLPVAVGCFSIGSWNYLRHIEPHYRPTD
jgi:hypothetical protein